MQWVGRIFTSTGIKFLRHPIKSLTICYNIKFRFLNTVLLLLLGVCFAEDSSNPHGFDAVLRNILHNLRAISGHVWLPYPSCSTCVWRLGEGWCAEPIGFPFLMCRRCHFASDSILELFIWVLFIICHLGLVEIYSESAGNERGSRSARRVLIQ